jgi:hypothetical protein
MIPVVQRACDELPAGTGLAADEHRRLARRRQTHGLRDRPHGRRVFEESIAQV